MNTFRYIRLGALAAALAMALPAVHAAEALTTPKVNFGALQNNGRYDRFIVTFRAGSTENVSSDVALQNVRAAVARTGMNRAAIASNGASVAALDVRYTRPLSVAGAHVISATRKLSQSEASAFMQQIAADPAVAHVEIDALLQPIDAQPAAVVTPVVPNDPLYQKYQWHMRPGNGTMEQIGSDTTAYPNLGGSNVANAWNVADGTGVTVAVLDTGITQHPDLDLSLANAGYDFISSGFISGRATDGRVAGGWDTGDWTSDPTYTDPTNGCVAAPGHDSSWHGTHVSGTIAELTNNGVGMAGVANKARVLPVRVLGHCGGQTSDIADAITWASGGQVPGMTINPNPVQIISMSLGGASSCSASDVTGVAIAGAISRGVTVVVAAGNSNADVSGFTPASCPGVIAVAANGMAGKRAFYSDYGSGIAISAPGGGIYPGDASSGTVTQSGFVWSTINAGTHSPIVPSATVPASYGGMAGTSQATPHVSGIVALMLGAQMKAGLTLSTPKQILGLLGSTARPFPAPTDQPIGPGIVDAYTAVEAALGNIAQVVATLTDGVPYTGQSGAAATSAVYSLTVPAGHRNLTLRTYGGKGTVITYVKAGVAPLADGSNADYTSSRPGGTTQTTVIASPLATTYYIRVVGVAAYSGVSVLGVYQ